MFKAFQLPLFINGVFRRKVYIDSVGICTTDLELSIHEHHAL